jgi:hypothetical protein
MTVKAEILSRFSGEASEHPVYLPDLTLWYEWHKSRDTLPDEWKDFSLPEIARAMEVPIWLTTRPWRVETPGIKITTTEQENKKVVRSETSAGTLVSKWTLGPDGDWWQTEYPVKTAEDLTIALELVNSLTYVLDSADLVLLEEMAGDDGILALEIPRRPYSELLHVLLGWGEGLMLLGEPVVHEILTVLEAKLQNLVDEVAHLPGHIIFAPDNLDGQFISPGAFKKYLAGSYRQTTNVLHQHKKRLLVHVGGPIRHLLAPLAETGVDALDGIAGPPQSDASLAQAREIGGTNLTLWGGIPQDFLLKTHDSAAFEAAVTQAFQEASSDRRMILGVADRIPVNTELSRIKAIPTLIR